MIVLGVRVDMVVGWVRVRWVMVLQVMVDRYW